MKIECELSDKYQGGWLNNINLRLTQPHLSYAWTLADLGNISKCSSHIYLHHHCTGQNVQFSVKYFSCDWNMKYKLELQMI